MIEISGSVLVAFSVLIVFIAFTYIPQPETPQRLPPSFFPVIRLLTLFILAAAIFGIFTGASLIRLKNWARIVTIVWAGLTSVFCGLIVLVFLFVPIPVSPNQPPGMESFARMAVFIFYGFPLAIGLWWLILFNSKSIVDQFRSGGMIAETTMSGGPLGQTAEIQFAKTKPSCPLPVAVIAGFSLFSALSFVFILFFRTPVLLFGFAIAGAAGKFLWLMACSLYVASGIGMFRLKLWSYPIAIGLQAFWLFSGTVSMLSGNFENVMREAVAASPLTANQTFTPEYFHMIRVFSSIGLLVPVVILGILVYYRGQFLEAADAARLEA